MDLVSGALEQAHTNSVTSGDGFAAEIFPLLEDTLKLQAKLNLIRRAETDANASGKAEPQ